MNLHSLKVTAPIHRITLLFSGYKVSFFLEVACSIFKTTS